MHCSDADNEADICNELIDRAYDKTGVIIQKDSIRVQHRPLIVPMTIRDKTKTYQSITTKILSAKTIDQTEIHHLISTLTSDPTEREQYTTTYDYNFLILHSTNISQLTHTLPNSKVPASSTNSGFRSISKVYQTQSTYTR